MEDVSRPLVLGGIVAALIVARTVLAAPVPTEAAACWASFKDLTFSAHFEWDNWGGKRQIPLLVQFGNAREGSSSYKPVVRMVDKKGRCQAQCEIQAWTRNADGSPVSAELACRAPGFDALTSAITIFWSHPKTSVPTIRFGKWLDGYVESPLRVETDQLSPRKLAASKI